MLDIRQNLIKLIWRTPITKQPLYKRIVLRVSRLGFVLSCDVGEGQLTLRAMSLVYTTLLSIVPLLAVSFSVLKAFGVHNQIEPLVFGFVEPLGDQGQQIAKQTLSFIDNMRVGVLGSVGVAMLFYTVISLIKKIEDGFNYVWHVRQARSFSQRFSDYLSVLMIGPVLIFASVGAGSSFLNHNLVQSLLEIEPFGTLYVFFLNILPFLLLSLAFTFIYMFIPNTKVQFKAAFVGSLCSAFLWQSVGWLFTSFVVGAGTYTAIYSGFAAILMFMIWLYLAWLILLIGSNVAFYIQHPENITLSWRSGEISNYNKDVIAISILIHLTRSLYQKEDMWRLEALAKKLDVSSEVVRSSLSQLETGKLVVATAEQTYTLAHAADDLKLSDVIDRIRSTPTPIKHGRQQCGEDIVHELFGDISKAIDLRLKNKTLKDIALA